jgi:hypothetical protein
MPTKQVFYIAQTDLLIDRLNSTGPGDEDVNSKSGRTTTVTVKSSAPAPAMGASSVFVTVDYTVSEGRSDYTRLKGSRVVEIQLESGARFNSFGAGFVNADYTEVIGGERHNWFDISDRAGIRGSILQWCEIKMDGKGDDDQGNAQLSAHLAVPLVVDIEAENPATGGATSTGTQMLGTKVMPGLFKRDWAKIMVKKAA